MKQANRITFLFKRIVPGIVLGMLSLNATAQFSLSGQVRPRTEYRHGFRTLPQTDQDAAVFTDQRTRITAGYKAKGFETFIQIQDLRTWGATSQLNTTDPFLSMHQAWGKAYLNDKWSLKLGRQEINLDDQRIFWCSRLGTAGPKSRCWGFDLH